MKPQRTNRAIKLAATPSGDPAESSSAAPGLPPFLGGTPSIFQAGICFCFDDMLLAEDTGAITFESAEAEQRVRAVFDRWGFELEDFNKSSSDMDAAYQVFAVDFGRWAQEDPEGSVIAPRLSPALSNPKTLAYLKAVRNGDLKRVKKLLPGSGLVEHMAAAREHRHALDAAELEPRQPRGDARKHPVLGPWLGSVVPGSRDSETVADVAKAALRAALAHMKALGAAIDNIGRDKSRRRLDPTWAYYALRDGRILNDLASKGLVLLEDCPRRGESAFLFERKLLPAFLDSTDHRDTWRQDFGPFVGFDAQMRLIVEPDLRWFRLENRHNEHHFGSPLEQPPAPPAAVAKAALLSPKSKGKTLPTVKAWQPNGPDSEWRVTLCVGQETFESADAFSLGAVAALKGARTVMTPLDSAPFEPLLLRWSKHRYHYPLRRAGADLHSSNPYEEFHQGLRGMALLLQTANLNDVELGRKRGNAAVGHRQAWNRTVLKGLKAIWKDAPKRVGP
jgi:hypothetical protein